MYQNQLNPFKNDLSHLIGTYNKHPPVPLVDANIQATSMQAYCSNCDVSAF